MSLNACMLANLYGEERRVINMMLFGSSGGCYIKHVFDSTATGSIAIDGFQDLTGIVATGYNEQRRDSNFIQRCFGGKNYIYGFGQDISAISVQAVALLTTATSSIGNQGASIGDIYQTYLANSLSKKGSVKISFPTASQVVEALLINMTIETQQVETNVHACQFDFRVVDQAGQGIAGAEAGGQTSEMAARFSASTALRNFGYGAKFSASTALRHFG